MTGTLWFMAKPRLSAARGDARFSPLPLTFPAVICVASRSTSPAVQNASRYTASTSFTLLVQVEPKLELSVSYFEAQTLLMYDWIAARPAVVRAQLGLERWGLPRASIRSASARARDVMRLATR